VNYVRKVEKIMCAVDVCRKGRGRGACRLQRVQPSTWMCDQLLWT
jgi:hypothetical protein